MEKIDKPKLKTILEMDADIKAIELRIKAIELRIKELEGHKCKMEQFSDGFIYLFAMKCEGRNMWQVPTCSDDLLHNMQFLDKNYSQYSNFRVWTSNKEFAYAGAEITYIDFYHEIADVNAVVFLEHEKLI